METLLNIHLSMELVSGHSRGILRGVAAAVEARGLPWRLTSDWTEVVKRKVWMREVAGVIGFLAGEQERAVWKDAAVPLVNISAAVLPDPSLVSVVPDNVEVGREAGRYVRARGFRSFAFVSAGRRWYEEQRLEGFAETVGEAGPLRVLRIHGKGGLPLFLKGLPEASAVFGATDAVARTVLTELLRAGRLVPEDLIVLGVDGDEVQSAFAPVPLSSIDLRSEEIGRLAAEAMEDLLAGRRHDRRTTVPPGPVVERQSTNLIAVPDPRIARLLHRIRRRACEGIQVRDLLEPGDGPRRTIEVKFRRLLGRSIGEEIRRCRLEAARARILLTRQPLAVIAEDCGFANVYHFSRRYKEAYGQSPGRARLLRAEPRLK